MMFQDTVLKAGESPNKFEEEVIRDAMETSKLASVPAEIIRGVIQKVYNVTQIKKKYVMQ